MVFSLTIYHCFHLNGFDKFQLIQSLIKKKDFFLAKRKTIKKNPFRSKHILFHVFVEIIAIHFSFYHSIFVCFLSFSTFNRWTRLSIVRTQGEPLYVSHLCIRITNSRFAFILDTFTLIIQLKIHFICFTKSFDGF